MADPLIRAIMSNTANQKGRTSLKSRSLNDSSTSNMHLTSKEEEELINIMKKGSHASSKNYNYSKSEPAQKIKLEDLVGAKGKPKTEKRQDKRANTMMTLDDLANKTKGNLSSEKVMKKSSSTYNKPYNKGDNQYVKTNVIGNLEAYVPKVSLNSIGKKGSLM